MSVHVIAIDRPDVPQIVMSERFRHEITFFASDHGPAGEPLGPGEWWIDRREARAALDDGVIRIASPLASEGRAEIEHTEEQEAWLEWIDANGVDRVRLE